MKQAVFSGPFVTPNAYHSCIYVVIFDNIRQRTASEMSGVLPGENCCASLAPPVREASLLPPSIDLTVTALHLICESRQAKEMVTGRAGFRRLHSLRNHRDRAELAWLGHAPTFSFGVAQDGLYAASAAITYCTETVTPFWLMFQPIDTVIGRSPDCALDGICTLSCINPATRSGASPAYT